MAERIAVLLVDDHPLLRDGVRAALERDPQLAVVAEATTVAGCAAAAAEHRPDVVLLDLSLPDGSGLTALPELAQVAPGAAVLVLTSSGDVETVRAALRAGARGYVVKGAGGDQLVAAVRAAAGGQLVLDPEVAGAVLAPLTAEPGPADPFPELSAREREVLALLARGHGTDAIARALFLSPKTVRNHLSHAYAVLGVADRAQAVAVARDRGLV